MQWKESGIPAVDQRLKSNTDSGNLSLLKKTVVIQGIPFNKQYQAGRCKLQSNSRSSMLWL